EGGFDAQLARAVPGRDRVLGDGRGRGRTRHGGEGREHEHEEGHPHTRKLIRRTAIAKRAHGPGPLWLRPRLLRAGAPRAPDDVVQQRLALRGAVAAAATQTARTSGSAVALPVS